MSNIFLISLILLIFSEILKNISKFFKKYFQFFQKNFQSFQKYFQFFKNISKFPKIIFNFSKFFKNTRISGRSRSLNSRPCRQLNTLLALLYTPSLCTLLREAFNKKNPKKSLEFSKLSVLG